MHPVTEVLVFSLRDGVHYCARVTNDDGRRYTEQAKDVPQAMEYASRLIQHPLEGRRTKPNVSDPVLNDW